MYYLKLSECSYLKINEKGDYIKLSKFTSVTKFTSVNKLMSADKLTSEINIMRFLQSSESVTKLDIYIITVLVILTAGADIADTNKSLTLKQVITSSH